MHDLANHTLIPHLLHMPLYVPPLAENAHLFSLLLVICSSPRFTQETLRSEYISSLFFSLQPDAWGLDFRRNEEIIKTAFGQYSTELFTAEAERLIENHDTSQVGHLHGMDPFWWQPVTQRPPCPFQPLFLYVAQQAVHSANPNTGPAELEAPWKYERNFQYIKNEKRRKFAGEVLAGDIFQCTSCFIFQEYLI